MDPGYRIATVLAMAAAIAACLVSVPGSDSEGAEGGACGDGLVWSLNGTELHIDYTGTGDGTMDDYGEEGAPWGKHITAAILDDGVRSIGIGAFSDCWSLIHITFGYGLTDVEEGAFDVHVFYDKNNYTRLPIEAEYLAGNTFDGVTVERMVLQENKNPVSNIPDYMAYACILVTIIAVLGTWVHQRMRPRYRCTSFL